MERHPFRNLGGKCPFCLFSHAWTRVCAKNPAASIHADFFLLVVEPSSDLNGATSISQPRRQMSILFVQPCLDASVRQKSSSVNSRRFFSFGRRTQFRSKWSDIHFATSAANVHSVCSAMLGRECAPKIQQRQFTPIFFFWS